eukprot:356122-Chlamydomonas_euryale.AAC.2
MAPQSSALAAAPAAILGAEGGAAPVPVQLARPLRSRSVRQWMWYLWRQRSLRGARRAALAMSWARCRLHWQSAATV